MVRVIATSLPRFPALRLAIRLAASAMALVSSKHGLSLCCELLSLYGHNLEASEVLRDVAAMIAHSLQGHIGT